MQPLPQSAAAGPSDIPFDLRYYLDLVWRGRALILAATLAGLGLGLLAGFLQTPQYQAAVLLQIEPPTPTFMSVSDALVGGGSYYQNADFYNTQFKILHSRGVGEKVVGEEDRLCPLQVGIARGERVPVGLGLSHQRRRLCMVQSLPQSSAAAPFSGSFGNRRGRGHPPALSRGPRIGRCLGAARLLGISSLGLRPAFGGRARGGGRLRRPCCPFAERNPAGDCERDDCAPLRRHSQRGVFRATHARAHELGLDLRLSALFAVYVPQ